MDWDDTTRRRNSAGERYTHAVRDGVLTHKCVDPGASLRQVAEIYATQYDGTCVAIVADLQTGREERFAVLAGGSIDWQTDEEYTSG